MKLDDTIKTMSFGERGKEVQRARNILRAMKRKTGHAKCQFNEARLYDLLLPEGSEGMGRMNLPFEVLLAGCKRYIRHQQKGLTIIGQNG